MGNKLVCLVGMPGSGKSEVGDFFVQQGYQYIRFGQITLDEVKRRGLAPTEANERPIREAFRQKYGMAAFAILNLAKFDAGLIRGNVIGDGLYGWSEYKVLKEKYGKDLVIVAVYASPQTRYARLEERASRHGQDEKMKYRSFPRVEAESRDQAEIENLEKGGPIAMADYTIINEGSLGELSKEVKKIYKKINAA
ncbi:MAG: AAA family ATPase [Patescibacteria group bacterium]